MITPQAAGNYLTSLFLQTKYQCEHRKLQKLAIFSDIIYYFENGEPMLEENSVSATCKGLSVDALSREPYIIIFNLVNEPGASIDIKKISDDSLKLGFIYGENPDLPYDNKHKKCLREVFSTFGAYSGDALTEMSKKTYLWQDARIGKNDDEVAKITVDLYKKFINELRTKSLIENNDFTKEYIIKTIKGNH